LSDYLTELEQAAKDVNRLLTNLVVCCSTSTTSDDFQRLQSIDPVVYEDAIETVRELIANNNQYGGNYDRAGSIR